MLARQHANIGLAGTLASVAGLGTVATAHPHSFPALQGELHGLDQPVALIILGVIGTAFALVPDLDEPKSTVSRKFGGPGGIISRIFRVLMFGHRGLSHSLVFSIAAGAVGWAITHLVGPITVAGVTVDTPRVIVSIIFVCSVMLIAKLILPLGLGKRYYAVLVFISIAVTVLVGVNGLIPPSGLALAMFLGINLHVLGDSLTPSGTAYLAPFSSRKFSLPINGATGEDRELHWTQPICIVLALGTTYLLVIRPLIDPLLS